MTPYKDGPRDIGTLPQSRTGNLSLSHTRSFFTEQNMPSTAHCNHVIPLGPSPLGSHDKFPTRAAVVRTTVVRTTVVRAAIGVIAGIFASMMGSSRMLAQTPSQGNSDRQGQYLIDQAVKKSFNNALMNALSRKVLIAPALVNADPHAQTATFEFINASDDSLSATVTAGVVPPPGFRASGANRVVTSGGHAGDTSSSASKGSSTSFPVDTIQQDVSLASWIQDLPSSVVLAPHEKKSVTVHLTVPSNLKPGEYAAWIVTSATLIASNSSGQKVHKGMTLDLKGRDGKPVHLHGGAKLVYTAK